MWIAVDNEFATRNINLQVYVHISSHRISIFSGCAYFWPQFHGTREGKPFTRTYLLRKQTTYNICAFASLSCSALRFTHSLSLFHSFFTRWGREVCRFGCSVSHENFPIESNFSFHSSVHVPFLSLFPYICVHLCIFICYSFNRNFTTGPIAKFCTRWNGWWLMQAQKTITFGEIIRKSSLELYPFSLPLCLSYSVTRSRHNDRFQFGPI